jgi:hypothetical protein
MQPAPDRVWCIILFAIIIITITKHKWQQSIWKYWRNLSILVNFRSFFEKREGRRTRWRSEIDRNDFWEQPRTLEKRDRPIPLFEKFRDFRETKGLCAVLEIFENHWEGLRNGLQIFPRIFEMIWEGLRKPAQEHRFTWFLRCSKWGLELFQYGYCNLQVTLHATLTESATNTIFQQFMYKTFSILESFTLRPRTRIMVNKCKTSFKGISIIIIIYINYLTQTCYRI